MGRTDIHTLQLFTHPTVRLHRTEVAGAADHQPTHAVTQQNDALYWYRPTSHQLLQKTGQILTVTIDRSTRIEAQFQCRRVTQRSRQPRSVMQIGRAHVEL